MAIAKQLRLGQLLRSDDRGHCLAMVTRSAAKWHRVGCDCQRQKQWTQWDGPKGDKHFNIKMAYIEIATVSRVQHKYSLPLRVLPLLKEGELKRRV